MDLLSQNFDATLYGNQEELKLIRERLQLKDASLIEQLDFSVKSTEDFCWESPKDYYVLIAYKNEDSNFHLKKMKPYKYDNPANDETQLGYGWCSEGQILENVYMACNPCWDDEVVLGWIE